MASSQSIYQSAMSPVSAPDAPYSPASDVIEYRGNSGASIFQEIYGRSNGAMGFRYRAWVNFADAGGQPHQMWWDIQPDSSAFVDDVDTAKAIAEAYAASSGEQFANWVSCVSNHEDQ